MSKSIIKQKRILTKAAGGSSLATPVSVANGGTGISSYAIGDIIYASGATTLSKLADVATGNALISGGVGTAPSWGKISESHLSFSDVTTVNVSNSAHGLFPKLTTNSIYYVNNSGELTALTVGASGTVLTGNGVTSAPTWTAVSSGITVGTTTITSGTSLRIPYNLAGVYQEQANFTIGAVATGILDVPSGYAQNGATILRAVGNGGNELTYLGNMAGSTPTQTGRGGTYLGFGSGRGGVTGQDNISIGAASNYAGGTFSYSLFIGSSAASSSGMQNTANNQAVIGMPNGNGYTKFYFGQGVSAVTGTPSGVTFNATPGTIAGGLFTILGGAGSGSDKLGGNLVLGPGQSTGSGTPAVVRIQGTVAGASSSTAQTLSTVFEVTNSTSITISDSVNFLFNTGTGTKLGTATTQKIGFWGVTPVTQYATTGTTTGFTANASANTLFNESTFTGDTGATAYTISDLVKALKLCGIILA